ncbi:secoisolariciresinol dehydrogenase-like [Cucumis melo var. makuwa]|uniref:Secoisolariciresinol dehydrogenase-like n=2 Tax=Cucumis melo TaxID=3656 RepID=A0A5D3DPN9_CUCMM|nr:secoisolariciresinol dehydrogenase-like [Cucumis melo var. makuwa]TYK25289.1 secoisolariciresinol dehydrogenase-like [Cucumis melo var. makuwa]
MHCVPPRLARPTPSMSTAMSQTNPKSKLRLKPQSKPSASSRHHDEQRRHSYPRQASNHRQRQTTRQLEFGQFGIRVNCLSPYGLARGMVTKLDGMQFEMVMSSMANLKGV